MVIGKLHFGKKKKPVESAPTETEAVADELPEEVEEGFAAAVVPTEEKPKKKKIKLGLPPINRETLEKFLKKLLSPRDKKKKKKVNFTARKAIMIAAVLLFCFIMITPVRNCVFSSKDFVSSLVAEEMSLADSGITSEKAENLSCDMIKLDEQMCYKVEFTSGKNGYKYIVSAGTGEIIAQAFYQIENEEG